MPYVFIKVCLKLLRYVCIFISVAYLVDFDPGDDALLNEHINDLLTIDGGLVESLLKKNGARDVLAKARD